MVSPEVAKIAGERAGKVIVAKVDTEALPQVASRFGIRSIPTMILFRDGKEAKRLSGAMPASKITEQLSLKRRNGSTLAHLSRRTFQPHAKDSAIGCADP